MMAWQCRGQGFVSPQLHPGVLLRWVEPSAPCARSRTLTSPSCGTATGTATRLGLLRTVAYFTGRRTPCHLRKWHAGEVPWTGRSCLGVKGSQVQILSARQCDVAGHRYSPDPRFVGPG